MEFRVQCSTETTSVLHHHLPVSSVYWLPIVLNREQMIENLKHVLYNTITSLADYGKLVTDSYY